MPTYGNTALTFTDLRKRMDPDGKIAWIMEIMAQSNPIMQHIPWMEGNLRQATKQHCARRILIHSSAASTAGSSRVNRRHVRLSIPAALWKE